MALRADEATAMRALIERYLHVAERTTGQLRQLERRWFSALLGAPAEAVAEVKEVAAGFEAIAFPGQAADAWADAAFLAARLGDADEAAALATRARTLYAACSGVPMLGDEPPGVDPGIAADVTPAARVGA
jgi:hypothetical protein